MKINRQALASLLVTLKKDDLIPELTGVVYRQSLKSAFRIGTSRTFLYHRLDEWDTKLFKMKVGKVEIVAGKKEAAIRQVLDSLLKLDYKYLIFRLPANEKPWVQAIEKTGGITLDTTVDLVFPISRVKYPRPSYTRLPKQEDNDQVKRIAKSFSSGRFFSDPDIKVGRKVYSTWIRNSLSGQAADKVFVYKKADQIHGFASVKLDKIGEISLVKVPLVGKTLDSQEQGVASTLLDRVKSYAAQNKCQGIVITTQGSNIQALRAYLKAEFKPYASSVTLRILKKH